MKLEVRFYLQVRSWSRSKSRFRGLHECAPKRECEVVHVLKMKISHIYASLTLSHLAGVFKESKLREVHPEGPAGGPHAAGTEVSPPPSGKQTVSAMTAF